MEFYTFLRHMADSWGLLTMLLIFLGVCLWAMRPSSRTLHDDAANSIFRNDSRPAEASQPARKEA
ncbi:CcoQ/FixQ family Cbb3-type cytochrome c oxidase assembly chaperone [Rhodobacter sp.]